MTELTASQVVTDISELKRLWTDRDRKFKEWYDALCLVDTLAAKDMESFVANDPRTFFNMAHYLLTAGDIRHDIPISSDSPIELDKQARVGRGCQYMWRKVDEKRQGGGSPSFIGELDFFLLLLGWYSLVMAVDDDNLLIPQLWSPAETYPRFEDNLVVACVHTYKTSVASAARKAKAKGWSYTPKTNTGDVKLDDYFYLDTDGVLQNMILIDSRDVTGVVSREDMKLLVAPVAGFPDRGSIKPGTKWSGFIGQGILETDASTVEAYNKWMSFLQQILRDIAQTKYQEFSASPQATPEQLRERGGLWHYAPGEQGLQAVLSQPIPLELRASLMDMDKKIQKGAFSDAVYGMVERGTAGYALSMLSSSSANQILYPYMQAKHFIIEECDKFWLGKLKTSKKVFGVRGKIAEQLRPTDIPEDVDIEVNSEMATQKDWLERATIANMIQDHVDEETIISEVLKLPDAQTIKRRKKLDKVRKHPMTEQLELAAGYYAHADWLDSRGDSRQAAMFRRAAQALEMQFGAPPPGAAKPAETLEAEAARASAAPGEKARVRPEVAPPETRGFPPGELRGMIGRGRLS